MNPDLKLEKFSVGNTIIRIACSVHVCFVLLSEQSGRFVIPYRLQLNYLFKLDLFV